MENIPSPIYNSSAESGNTPTNGELAITEIFKDAQIKDGLPQLNPSKIIEVLEKFGFKDVVNHQSP